MRAFLRIFIPGFLVMVMLVNGCSKNELRQTPPGEPKAERSDQYVIGPEDVLQIEVWREQNLSGKVPVRMDGKISLPLIYDVQAAGLTPIQLQEILVQKLKDFVDSPDVSVTVLEANSFKVYVSGQVKNPGVFKLRAETNLLQVISMAGGFTDWANQKKILIIRREDGKENRIIANHKKMVNGEQPALVLKSGDTVIVP